MVRVRLNVPVALLAAVAGFFLGVAHLHAGVYSAHSSDAANAYDAPIAGNDPRIVGWATTVVDYSPVGTITDDEYAVNSDPANALGPAGDSYIGDASLRTVALGELSATAIANDAQPGSITLGFAQAITNGSGADFAVYENSFGNMFSGNAELQTYVFGELAFVEVSTDGVNFARFAGISSHEVGDLDTSWSTVGTHDFAFFDPTGVYNLAGKHLADWGTPFDLDNLANDALVVANLVDLNEINFVRIVDIPGDGSTLDSLGNPIFDSWYTIGGGGFDLDAVGVIHQLPEPASLTLLALAGMVALRRRRN